MKKGIRKNQVVIATLAVLIAIAGYISYDKTGFQFDGLSKKTNANSDKGESSEKWEDMVWSSDNTEIISDTEQEINPGESVLTGTMINAADYAASVKLNREEIRAKNKETLLEIINNEQLKEENKKEAVNEMVKMTDIAEKEADAEMLLEAKGFKNVVVSISDECCDVVLDMGEVTDAKRAQVEDVVKRKTGMEADKIVITPINPK
ncbi:MAG: SpoIIIAH-like family protein [Lachnospiraceae bacterium]|nr:SpoIIIAH-like family protein [Lachnospiraceae bacterium]